jgi:hypothetical protein
MIDPKVSLANAMTSIKKARAMKLEKNALIKSLKRSIGRYRTQASEGMGVAIRLAIEERRALIS